MNPNDAAAPRFTIDIEKVADGAIAKCHGYLVAGQTELIHSHVKPLLTAHGRVILDLTDLVRMDSMGLGAIVSLTVSAKRAGCEFEMVNLGKRIRQLFAITNLLTLFESAGDNTFRII